MMLWTAVAFAQNNRLVQGYVQKQDGTPLQGAIIKSENSSLESISDSNGAFEIKVSPYARNLIVSCEGYYTAKAEIEGGYIVVRLRADKNIFMAAPQEAMVKAEELQQQDPAISEENTKDHTEQDALANEKAEEEPRIPAENEGKREEKAKTRKQERGFGSIVDVSYMQRLSGNIKYPAMGISYIGGYHFNSLTYLGLGVGVNYNIKGGPSYRDVLSPSGDDALSPSMMSVPVFAYFKANFINKPKSPFFAVAAGASLSKSQTLYLNLCEVTYGNNSVFVNPQLGFDIRTTTKTSLSLSVGYQCFTAPVCREYTGYNAKINSAFISGLDFHLSFTF